MFWKPFSEEDEKQIKLAIELAEDTCSGEIRIHVDRHCKGNPMFKASNIFFHLNMDKTAASNGVLIYMAIEDKQFAIIGDKGINEKVPADFWESTKSEMVEYFVKNQIVNGLVHGINEAGKQLAMYFPHDPNDKNELSDEISYGS